MSERVVSADQFPTQSSAPSGAPLDRVRPLLRVRQVRDFTPEPVSPQALDAIADAARWSGSSSNSQPWRFVTLLDESTIRAIGEAALPQTRGLMTATAAVAIVLPDEPGSEVRFAYDEGRATERILIAASFLGLGGGINWIVAKHRPRIAELLSLPSDRMVRTIVAIGHPTEAARQPKSAPGQARLPRQEVVFEERWPAG